MILTCPECGTQYAVKDGAIPDGGRRVRCASCGHSWHEAGQDGPAALQEQGIPAVGEDSPGEPAMPEQSPYPEEAGYDPDDSKFDIVTPAESESEAEPDVSNPPLAVPLEVEEGWPDQVAESEDWDPAKEIPDAEEIAAVRSETGSDRKRNWLMAVVLAIVAVGIIVAALWFLAPDSLRQKVGLVSAGPTPLQIAPGVPERQKLASGNELVMVSGRVINPSATAQQVPPIEAQLRDAQGKLLYSWTIAPPARSLPPGGSASFNSAEMNVPPSGLDSTVTLTLKG